MKKYRNSSGCSMEFEDGISLEQVKERMGWMGKGWRDVTICPRCGLNPNCTQPEDQQEWEEEFLYEKGICSACERELTENEAELGLDDTDSYSSCLLCGRWYLPGHNGNELGFCLDCQNDPDFPYDLDRYYRDYDAGKTVFKGFDTMSRGLLEPYRRR